MKNEFRKALSAHFEDGLLFESCFIGFPYVLPLLHFHWFGLVCPDVLLRSHSHTQTKTAAEQRSATFLQQYITTWNVLVSMFENPCSCWGLGSEGLSLLLVFTSLFSSPLGPRLVQGSFFPVSSGSRKFPLSGGIFPLATAKTLVAF